VTANNFGTNANENVSYHLCSTATNIATGTIVTLDIGTSTVTNQPIVNPAVVQSYVIRLGGSNQSNSGDTRVAVVNNVLVTASVDTSFTFTVSPVNSGLTYNGITTNINTTQSTIPFGTITPGVEETGAQTLNVATNASHGFVVTVQENQPLTDSTGDIIYLFKDGATTSPATAWTSPLGTINKANTYGHFGVSSTDDINSNEFSGSKYVGSIINPYSIFSHNAPADGVTDNIGSSTILYSIQITALQAAGNDYQNTLRYVATPTF
jgi:hypothetical protein